MTLAFFQTEGKVPVCSDRLNNDVNEGAIVCPESLRRRALILSNPVALLGFKRLIASLTKLSEISWKQNPKGLSSGWLEDDKSGNFSASFLPILTKKLFKIVAIESSEVTTVPLPQFCIYTIVLSYHYTCRISGQAHQPTYIQVAG